jgi:EAL domain-containing protein (putative c-di-GMP-specific phosphodiesterase class I)
MQTVVMPENATAVPWLEVDFHGGSPERVLLEKFPFIMGRGETADLRVPSTRVSREHAVITKQGRTFTLRDLGSTNGTFINGKRTTEAPLNDGDVVLLADEQLTFSNGENTPRQMTTQVMGARGAKGESELPDTKFLIAAVRRLQEAVVHRSGQLRFQPIVSLLDGSMLGYDGIAAGDSYGSVLAPMRQVLETAHCRTTTRWRRAARRWAVEEAAQLPNQGLLFLPADPCEVGDDNLIAELDQLRSLTRVPQKLVVQLPEAAVSELPGLSVFRSQLHDLDVRLCFDEFAAGKAHVLQLKKSPPDYVKLASSAARGEVSQNRERQVASVVRAFRDLNCQVIATGIDTEEAADACRQWECPYAQGKLFGEPRPLFAVSGPDPKKQVGRRSAAPVGASALST